MDTNDDNETDTKIVQVQSNDKEYDPVLYIIDSLMNKSMSILTMGVIIYKKSGKDLSILITLKDAKYEDMYMNYDQADTNPCKTMIQGIKMRTNDKICIAMERIKNGYSVYIPKSKHLVFIIEADNNEMKLVKEDFGFSDHGDNKYRTIGWINRSELAKSSVIHFKLNQRIKSKTLFDKLYNIESNFRISCKLFRS